MKYVELHAASAFSFLQGASVPEELAELCAHYDMEAMALSDLNGVYGAPRFHMAAKKAKVKAHIGAEINFEFRISDFEWHAAKPNHGFAQVHTDKPEGTIRRGSTRIDTDENTKHPPQRHRGTEKGDVNSKFEIRNSKLGTLPLLCADRDGYRNLCELITKMKLRVPKYGETSASAEELEEHASGLVCLTGDERGPLAQALARGGRSSGKAEAKRELERLMWLFGRENVFVELQRHYQREEEARNRMAIELARELHLPLLATNGVRYAQQNEREILDVFTCIHNHRVLDTAGRLLSRNSERRLKSPEEMTALFADLPEAIANTVELSSRLEFTLDKLGYEFPKYPVPEGETMMSFLRKRTDEGARARYLHPGKVDLWPRARRQIERELALIEKLQLEGYFLIVWDIVQHCRKHNILVQGRGSAANSAVCYSLGITAVDAVGMELLFERFLSEERGEWPDIDLDLPSGDQREKAIQYVYQRYGELGAAMTANVITYRGRSAAREMGKVLGFDEESTGRLSAMVGSWEFKDPSDTLERQFRDAGFDLRHPRIHKFFELCLRVQDLPRHLGQHSGGMVICQGQLNSVVPLEPATMPGRNVVQWDKDDCADMGIIKVDLLGLGMMAVLEETIEIIRRDYGDEVDLAHLPPDDPQVYGALQKADTVGMFQIESRAQMSCLPRLHPTRFYDIVVQVAIIRPGPIVGKMVHPYLARRQGKEPVVYPHPSLEPVLERTLGVPLFQEQLLRMAMIAAGFTGGEAEELRRAFGFKRSEKRMKDIEVKLRAGMDRNGIAQEAQEEIVRSMMAFALYGFPESHSASFALLAYASAFLKTHYLAAFTAALLNNQPMGFYHPSTIVKDAQRHGLKVLPIDVTTSEWQCTIEHSEHLSRRYGDTEDNFEFRISNFEKANHGFSRICADEIESGAVHGESTRMDADRALAVVGGDCKFEIRKSKFENHFAMRLGLRYVKGLREEAAQALVAQRRLRPFTSIDDLVRRVPELRKNELVALAEIGALNNFEFQISNFEKQHSASGIGQPQEHSASGIRHSAKPNHGFTRIVTDQSEENPPQRHRDAEKIARSERQNPPRRHGDTEESFEFRVSSFELNPGVQLPTASELGFKSEINNQKSHIEPSVRSCDGAGLNSKLKNQNLKLFHRRDALWQVERAARYPGPLLDREGVEIETWEIAEMHRSLDSGVPRLPQQQKPLPGPQSARVPPSLGMTSQDGAEDGAVRASWLEPMTREERLDSGIARSSLQSESGGGASSERVPPSLGMTTQCGAMRASPLEPMTREERLTADFHNTGLTVGPHPMAYRRAEMNRLRVLKAAELPKMQNGRRVRAAGCVIARQRPGTASGFVFLSMEDETGIANVIITPQLFEQHRMVIAGEQFLLVEGVLQHQEGVVSIRAEKVAPLRAGVATQSHDFH